MAGGETSTIIYTSAVEIFKPDTSQWYSGTDSLPVDSYLISLVAIGNTCYSLGGCKHEGSEQSYLSQVLYASVDDLLCNAVPANQTTYSGSSDTQSAWKTLPNTPTYGPAAAVLAGNLLAIGGSETPEAEDEACAKKEVYMYSPSTNSWIYISDVPTPTADSAVAVLSMTEILVIGGLDSENWVSRSVVAIFNFDDHMKTVYKGTLHLTP